MTNGKPAVEEIREALTEAGVWLSSAREIVKYYDFNEDNDEECGGVLARIAAALARLAELPTPEALAEAEERGRKAGYDAGYDAGYGAGFDECASDAVAHLLENDQGLMARDVRECLHVGAAKRWTARVAKGAEEGT